MGPVSVLMMLKVAINLRKCRTLLLKLKKSDTIDYQFMHVLNRYLHYIESDATGLVKQGKENVSKLYLSKYRMHLLILPHFHSRDDNI